MTGGLSGTEGYRGSMTEQAARAETPPADTEESDRHDEHLDDVEVGAGCTEIWEHLSERRAGAD